MPQFVEIFAIAVVLMAKRLAPALKLRDFANSFEYAVEKGRLPP